MFKTNIRIWSDFDQPTKNCRCTLLKDITIECVDHIQAKKETEKMILETKGGYSGFYNMFNHPNQNLKQSFVSYPYQH